MKAERPPRLPHIFLPRALVVLSAPHTTCRRLERDRAACRAKSSEETLAAFARFCELRDRDLAAGGADERTREMLKVTLETPSNHFDPPEMPVLAGPESAAREPSQPPA